MWTSTVRWLWPIVRLRWSNSTVSNSLSKVESLTNSQLSNRLLSSMGHRSLLRTHHLTTQFLTRFQQLFDRCRTKCSLRTKAIHRNTQLHSTSIRLCSVSRLKASQSMKAKSRRFSFGPDHRKATSTSIAIETLRVSLRLTKIIASTNRTLTKSLSLRVTFSIHNRPTQVVCFSSVVVSSS